MTTTEKDTPREVLAGQTEATVRQLSESFGGRLPTWEEFKRANRNGRVRGNKSVALRAMWWEGMPQTYAILYGTVVSGAAFLAVPVAIVLYFWPGISGWCIIGSVVLAAYLFHVAKEGACEAMKAGAERSEDLYQALVVRGAFLFEPSDE